MAFGRNFCITLFPMLGTVVTVALVIVMLLGCTPKASGLQNLYYMRVDLSKATSASFTGGDSAITQTVDSALQDIFKTLNIPNFVDAGVSGYCEGELSQGKTSNVTCHSPYLPYWFDLETIVNDELHGLYTIQLPDDVQSYMNMLKNASKVMWVFYIVGAVLCLLTLVFGLCSFHSRIASIVNSLLSFFGAVFVVLASALGTGIFKVYSHYFNNEASKYGIVASVPSRTLAVTWIAAAAAVWSFFWWVFSICCGSTRYSRRREVYHEDKQPFVGYNPSYQ